MIVRALDTDDDWTFGKGIQNYRRDLEALKQSLKTRILFFQRDCFYALNTGIDWYSYIGGKNVEDAVLISVKERILKTDGILRITALDFFLNENRNFSLTFFVDTIFGVNISDELDIVLF